MKKEMQLQFLSARSFFWYVFGMVLFCVININFYSIKNAGLAMIEGFTVLNAETFALRLFLLVFILVEAPYWFVKPYSGGTVQWMFFSGLDRRIHWRSRWSVLLLRYLLLWIICHIVIFILHGWLWGFLPYNLEMQIIQTPSQIERFVLYNLNSFELGILWAAFSFLLTTIFQTKKFQIYSVPWLLALLFIIYMNGNHQLPFSVLGGVMQNLFEVVRLPPGLRCLVALSMILPLSLAAILYLFGIRIYCKSNIFPQQRDD